MWLNMPESVNNNLKNNKGETQGLATKCSWIPQQNFSGGLIVALEVSRRAKGLNYWKNLVAKLMKRIPPAPLKLPLNMISWLIG